MKRLFDITASLTGLILTSPIFLFVPALIKLDSKGSVFFKQWRIGKNGKPFRIYKFRTMIQDARRIGSSITVGNDPRITRTGKLLRRYAIDELPTLFNVLKGDMSVVGPRPEVSEYLNCYKGRYEKVLFVRPGLTDLGTLAFRDEAKYLNGQNYEEIYGQRILPEKLELYLEYINHRSFFLDLTIIFKTLMLIVKQRKI